MFGKKRTKKIESPENERIYSRSERNTRKNRQKKVFLENFVVLEEKIVY